MKNLPIVFKFELMGLLKKKAYIITTVILCLLIIVVTSIPSGLKMFTGSAEPEDKELTQSYGILLNKELFDMELLTNKFAGLKISWYEDETAMKEDVAEGTIASGYMISSPTSYTSIVQDMSMYSEGDYLMDSALQEYAEDMSLREKNYDDQGIRNVLGGITVLKNTEILGQNVQNNFTFVYIMIMFTFMLIMFYGNNVATYVAREKSDRTMEILITSSDTKSLIIGKVLASGMAGIIQAGSMVLTLAVFYSLNYVNYSSDIRQYANLNVPKDIILVYALFSVVGYFLFLFMYAALGALMSKVEDVPAATTLVTMFVMVAYFICIFSLNLQSSMITKVASYIPFTSFMVMFVRYAISSVSLLAVSLSFLLLLTTAALMAFLSVKIYRFGTLNYGNSTNVILLIKKALRNDDANKRVE